MTSEDSTGTDALATQVAAERRDLEQALATCRTTLETAGTVSSRGGSAERIGRAEWVEELEREQAVLEGKLAFLDHPNANGS